MPPMSFGQGGPQWGAGGGPTPDWAALAEETERRRARRKRWLLVGGGALATVAVAGIVAVAVVNEGGGKSSADPSSSLPTPEDIPSSPGQPEPSFKEDRPPAPPEDFIGDPQKDTAPLSTETLFPDETVTVNGRKYARAATDSAKKCTSGAQAGLGPVLEKNGCGRFFRATYERGGLAFTLGIAVFDSKAAASAVKAGYKPNVASLSGGGVPTYCRSVTCRTTVNALGRYAFFTIAGHTDGKPAGASDEQAKQVALDGSEFGYGRILQRGKDQSAAEASAR